MSRVLFAWELGGGYGHLHSFPELALELRARGHEAVFALRDLTRAEESLGRHGFALLQAPLWLRVAPPGGAPASHAGLLHRFGFLDRQGLLGVVKAWRGLYELVRPDVVVLNHAPTATLASFGMGFPRVLFGTGLECPPPVSPLPAPGADGGVPDARLEDIEDGVLAVMNSVLGNLGVDPLDAFADLLDVEGRFLCTFPELDPYRDLRRDPDYRGPRFDLLAGDAPRWPGAAGRRRIFAYVKPRYPGFDRILDALAARPEAVLVHAPGVPRETVARYAGATLSFAARPLRMADVTEQSDLVVCHAGHGTTAAALLRGRPLLLLPAQREQSLTANRVAGEGAGIAVCTASGSPPFDEPLERLLAQAAFTQRARAFAARHAAFDAGEQVRGIVTSLEAIAARGARR